MGIESIKGDRFANSLGLVSIRFYQHLIVGDLLAIIWQTVFRATLEYTTTSVKSNSKDRVIEITIVI